LKSQKTSGNKIFDQWGLLPDAAGGGKTAFGQQYAYMSASFSVDHFRYCFLVINFCSDWSQYGE